MILIIHEQRYLSTSILKVVINWGSEAPSVGFSVIVEVSLRSVCKYQVKYERAGYESASSRRQRAGHVCTKCFHVFCGFMFDDALDDPIAQRSVEDRCDTKQGHVCTSVNDGGCLAKGGQPYDDDGKGNVLEAEGKP
jgi:hypothetical protein